MITKEFVQSIISCTTQHALASQLTGLLRGKDDVGYKSAVDTMVHCEDRLMDLLNKFQSDTIELAKKQ